MEQSFTTGKIYPALIKFAVPVLFAIILQAMYGAVDLFIVGQYSHASAVSAISTGSQLIQTITSVIIGFAMGCTVLIGQKLGADKQDEVGKIIGSSIYLFSFMAVIITILMLIFTIPLASLMHTPAEAFNETLSYLRICSLGFIFIIAYNIIGSIFRGIGDSKTPLMTVAISCIINIFGDLLLVAVFHMGAAGAAIATVLAQAISVIISLLVIKKKGLPFSFSKKDIRIYPEYVLRILKLGLPIALQDGLVSISFLVILSIVNSLGLIASAGVGVAEKLCTFIMLVPSALMQSMSAFVAQNVGAKKHDRAFKALTYGIITSVIIGIFMFFISFFKGDLLSSIFTHDIEVIQAAANYLKAYSIDCILTSFLFCFIGYFNGYGKTTFVMIQGIIGAFAVRIPVSYLMSRLQPVTLFKIGLVTPASSLVQVILCVLYFIVLNKKRKNIHL